MNTEPSKKRNTASHAFGSETGLRGWRGFVPNPIFCRLEMVDQLRSESPGEIMLSYMAVDKQYWRDEFLVIILQFLKRHVGSSTGVVPMEEPFFRAASTIGSGRGLVHENVEDRIGRPGNGLFRDTIRIGHRQTSRQSQSHIILVAASDGFPIGRLQLKPFVITLSRMLALVCGATKDLGPLQIGIQRADLGRRRTKIVESQWVLSSERIYTVLEFPIGFDNVRRREFAAVVIRVQGNAYAYLPQITQAWDDSGMLLGAGQRRQEQAGQDGNDGDDH